MFVPVDQSKNSLHEILLQIKKNVREGKLKKGDSLPAEREWATKLKVSRTTLREAIKSMAITGLLECSHGAGNFISKNLSYALAEPLSIMFMLEGGSMRIIREFRQAIEMFAVYTIAPVISPEEISVLEKICAEMDDITNANQLSQLNHRFHMVIIELTKNPLIITMMNAAQTLVREQMIDISENIIQTPDQTAVTTIQQQHYELLDALRAHDAMKALFIIIRHLEYSSTYNTSNSQLKTLSL